MVSTLRRNRRLKEGSVYENVKHKARSENEDEMPSERGINGRVNMSR